MSSDVCLCVFARAPVPGKVKTRLQTLLSPQAACDVHQQLMEACLAKMQHGNWRHQLWSTDSRNQIINDLSQHYHFEMQLQIGADLGERMHHAIRTAALMQRYIVVIGTDCPVISVEYINQALEKLQSAPVVLGPAEDGGYVLLAIDSQAIETNQIKNLFSNIPWGGKQVFATTCQRLTDSGCSWEQLERLWDVDNPDDYQRWQQLKTTAVS